MGHYFEDYHRGFPLERLLGVSGQFPKLGSQDYGLRVSKHLGCFEEMSDTFFRVPIRRIQKGPYYVGCLYYVGVALFRKCTTGYACLGAGVGAWFSGITKFRV